MSTKPDALLNLADAMAEDILNTPDDEVLREVEEDFGDRRALANKFDQILERAEKQVFESARFAAFAPSPQVRSSVLDLPISLRDETIRRVKGILNLASRLSEFLSSLTPRTLAWSATAAAVATLVPAAVITAVVVKEQGPPSGQQMAEVRKGEKGDRFQMEAVFAPQPAEVTSAGAFDEGIGGPRTQMPVAAPQEATRKLSDEEIAALVAGGRQLMIVDDIHNARLVLQQAADAGNATAALELGQTYDPLAPSATVRWGVQHIPDRRTFDVVMARKWYEKARDLGSAEAAVRLEKLKSVPD